MVILYGINDHGHDGIEKIAIALFSSAEKANRYVEQQRAKSQREFDSYVVGTNELPFIE